MAMQAIKLDILTIISSTIAKSVSISKSRSGSISCYGSSNSSYGGSITGNGSSVSGNGGGNGSYWGVSYSEGGSDLSDWSGKRSLVHDSVESVDGISGVVNGTYSAVGFHQTVCALDYITITALVLALGITGQGVLDVVSVAVLGMRVVVGVDSSYLSDSRGGVGKRSMGYSGTCVSHWSVSCISGSSIGHRGADDSGLCDGYDGGENKELWT